jgi:hypothetical protein
LPADYTFTSGDSGSHTFTITLNTPGLRHPTATDTVVTALSASAPVVVKTPSGVAAQNFVYYLPFVAKHFKGFSTNLTIQNLGLTSASVTAQYYDNSGASLNSVQTLNSTCSSLPVDAACLAPNPFEAGEVGTATLVSNQPLAVLVGTQTQFGGSAYAVSQGAAATLIAPLAINNATGFTTTLNLANVGVNPAKVTVSFYDQQGHLVSAATKSVSIASHASLSLDQASSTSQLPTGFYGWAKVEGQTGDQLVGQVLEERADIKFVALTNALPQASAQAQLYAPAIFKGAFGTFETGANIINTSDIATEVNITYYDSMGKAYQTTPFSLAGKGVAPIYQGASFGQGLPNGGLPQGFYGSAEVNAAAGSSLVMVVNEAGGLTKNGAAQSGSYEGVGSGASRVGLPVVANGGGGYTTGASILNRSEVAVSGSISYYAPDGSATGTVQAFSLAAHASEPVYQGGVGLGAGFRGQAIVTQSSGMENSLIVTTNAQSDDLFYTYTEPN